MRIEDTIRLTDGILQNFPSVTQTESIKIDPLCVKRGDLYLDINNSTDDQKTALKNGAFAIISEKIPEILDQEIAWIEVDSLRLACIKLSRYEFNRKNSKILFLDDISQEILHCITKNHEFIELSSNVYNTLVTIKKSGENVKYTCSDERLALSIDPDSKRLNTNCDIQKFKSKSPFYSSFTCNEKFCQDIKIPTIFIEKLCTIINFLKDKNMDFNVHNLSLSRHFSPVFIDHNLNKKEFGQGEKAVIFEENMDFLDFEIKYLSSFSKEIITCIPKRYRNYFSNYKNIFLFSSIDELKSLLEKNFRYILVFSAKADYESMFESKKRIYRSLF
ncbi:MAG: hypothetical protein QM482_07740 [Sulfurospirillum sp.]